MISRHVKLGSRLGLVLGIAVITVLSLLPGKDVAALDLLWDKAAHAMAYGVLALLVGLTFDPGSQRWIGILGLVCLGGLLEFGQVYVPGRSASHLDMLANGIGALLGIFLVHGFQRLWPQPIGRPGKPNKKAEATNS